MANNIQTIARIVLGSKSPRRAELLKELGLDFEILTADVDESLPTGINPSIAVKYLADKKAHAVRQQYDINSGFVIAADTIVVSEGEILGKPVDEKEALDFLGRLSGTEHEVYTGVSIIRDAGLTYTFDSLAKVTLAPITKSEMNYYVQYCKPYDKAGAYGIQEWIGWSKISKIEGTFATIMGLPVHEVYEYLMKNNAVVLGSK